MRWITAMSSESSNVKDRVSLGRIPLKQVRVPRVEKEPAANPMNRLVPYLDLFDRLDDAELARLASVDLDVCASLRNQVVAVRDGLAGYADLLPRLTDRELVRLTGAAERTIRFWRLCQPRAGGPNPAPKTVDSPAASTVPGRDAAPTRPSEHNTAPVGAPVRASDVGSGRLPGLPGSDGLPAAAAESSPGWLEVSGAPFPGFEGDEEQPPASLEPVSMDPAGPRSDSAGAEL